MADSDVTKGLVGATATIKLPDGKTAVGLPLEVVAAMFATHEPAALLALMDRAFGDADDALLNSLVMLANGIGHNIERVRRKRGMKPIQLRCLECSDARWAEKRMLKERRRTTS